MCTFKNHWTANMKLHLSYFFSPCCAQNYHQNKFWCGTKLPHENMSYGRVPSTWKTQLWLFLGKQQDRCVISNQVDLLWEGTFDYFQERTVPNPAGLICLKRKWRLLSSFSVGFLLSEPGYCKLGSVGAHLSLWSWWELLVLSERHAGKIGSLRWCVSTLAVSWRSPDQVPGFFPSLGFGRRCLALEWMFLE